ncbi:hypothetical protein U472_09715 [Orenia metallireducens]|uniref:Uncharacterized protein n=1 Tax=Orenia metallireducens TaxID=1413210 RepID=A0A1C0A7S9_9FIRM|nr:hypothetical protein [Orenia metallireducens]OCL26278.1 hypothetical protein U472_09715 [Orenia metallireducens]
MKTLLKYARTVNRLQLSIMTALVHVTIELIQLIQNTSIFNIYNINVRSFISFFIGAKFKDDDVKVTRRG